MTRDIHSASNVEPLRKARPCAECGKLSDREHYPFCSDRCRTLDLSKWLDGSYVIPVAAGDPDPVPEDDN